MQLQANVSPDIRRSLAAFTGQLVINHTGLQGIVHSAACLATLMRDNTPGVVKEAVLAFACLLRASLALVSLKVTHKQLRATGSCRHYCCATMSTNRCECSLLHHLVPCCVIELHVLPR
ncbi:hypothetical protein Vretimale_17136 [Volvox reticuliferus]|nr:hypothetical protein Vretimale_17136 [Volvox reticuliferus]